MRANISLLGLTAEAGTVIKVNGSIKVKWDGGRTSYFRHGERG